MIKHPEAPVLLILITIACISGVLHLASFFPAKESQCYWMENYSGKFEWVPANAVYRTVLTKAACHDLDSCDGGSGHSGGGCYKWATAPEAERDAW